MFIFIVGVLNAVGDVYALIWGLTHSVYEITGGIFFNAYFFGIFANRTLLLIFTPLTLLCSVLCLLFIGIRKLNLFKIFFLAAYLIGMAGLIVNLAAISPSTFIDVMVDTYSGTFFAGMILPMTELLRAIYLPTMIIGVMGGLGVLVACMFYFKRSKRIAAWFGSGNAQYREAA
ncbi:hypothetical protein FACS1894127_3350 [Clostridia bacterium]|nr:hypothetical protein FACS1894127_3350 [Clostridia bacterium]